MQNNWFERNHKKTIFILLIILFLAIIYGSEIYLRHKNHGIGFNFNLPDRAIRLREYRPNLEQRLQAGKKEVYYDTLPHKKFLLRIDANGFIRPSKIYANPDVSLVFLGGSTTECLFVEEIHRFPYLAGVLIGKKFRIKVNPYNGGRSGNDSLHSIDILLNKVFPIKPDIVVMMHNINDLSILLHEKSYWNKNSSRSVIFNINDEITSNYFKIMRDKLIPNLATALRNFDSSIKALWKSSPQENDEFAHIRGKPIVVDKAYLVGQFEMNLQAFISLCQARHIVPVLMTMPSRFKAKPDQIVAASVKASGLSYGQFKDLFDTFNEAIRQKTLENHILLIDLAREVPQTKEFMYDIVHYNDNGSIKAAQIISAQLAHQVKQILAKPKR